jgi:L,D-peptidoglycan transpeptidase YkuD (ErfK/YbiS/YcfS/YnhG family)
MKDYKEDLYVCARELCGALPLATNQALVVLVPNSHSSEGTLIVLERHTRQWDPVLNPIDVAIGRNGLAELEAKREGDGKTPSGLYMLESAFGYEREIETKMPYRQVDSDDIWVDDPESPDYNQWTRRGQTKARSFEEMRRNDGLYHYALITAYNRHPVFAGKGSAIFLHIRQQEGRPTAGCIAMAESALVSLLEWLNPEFNPVILVTSLEIP